MNKYKIIENNGGLLIDATPDYQKFMESGIEIESYSKHEAVCSIYNNSPNTWRQCYVLDTNTLKLFLVYWYRDLMGRITTTESFHSILEKLLMKKYKMIPNQNKHPDSITYEFMMDHFTVESDSPVNAFRKYCERDSFVLNSDSNFGYVLDTESLNLYYASWSINEQIGHSSFVKKLEKPEIKMNTYKILPHCFNSTYEDFLNSNIEIFANSPKEAYIQYYKSTKDAILDVQVLNLKSLNVSYCCAKTNGFEKTLYFMECPSYTVAKPIEKPVEKPKMKSYRLIPNQKNLNPSYEEMMASEYLIEAHSPKNALEIHRNLNPKVDCGMALDIGTLDLYRVLYSTSFLDGESYSDCFVRKLKPEVKMNKYKILLDDDSDPSFEKMMASKYSIEAVSPKNAFVGHRTINPRWAHALILDTETLDLYRVSFSTTPRREITTDFIKKLEKPTLKMNKYKLASKYSHLKNSTEIIEAENWTTAAINYYNNGNFVFGITNSCNIYVLNIETLTVYKVFLKKEITGKISTWSVEFKSETEKPMTKPKLNTLSFKTLTEANNKRLPLFKNSKGLPAHSKPDGSDWSHAEWLQAVIGELGEYANIMKKVQRGDLTMEEAKPSIEKELADVMTYFAILAQQLNIDLGQAVEDKFNEVSDRVKANVYISNDKVVTKNEMSSKDELRNELGKLKVKVKKENLTSQLYHKPVSFSSEQIKVDPVKWNINQDFATNLMVGVGLAQILTQFFKKPAQKTITLQDLNNGKVYTRPFISGQDSTTLQEFSKLIVKDATVMKTLLNGKDYDGFNANVGDMVQFSDDRNVLCSLRVTKIE